MAHTATMSCCTTGYVVKYAKINTVSTALKPRKSEQISKRDTKTVRYNHHSQTTVPGQTLGTVRFSLHHHKLPRQFLSRAALRRIVTLQRAQIGGAAFQPEALVALKAHRIGDDGQLRPALQLGQERPRVPAHAHQARVFRFGMTLSQRIRQPQQRAGQNPRQTRPGVALALERVQQLLARRGDCRAAENAPFQSLRHAGQRGQAGG